MKNLYISNSSFSNPRRVLPLWPALLLTLVLPLTGCAAGGPGSAGSTGYVLLPADQRLISALPPPQLSSIDLSGSCRNTNLEFESQRAQARWPAPGYIMPLQHWAMYHAGSRVAVGEPRCADNQLAVKLWQSAIGSPVTGQMSERDAAEFVRVIDAHDSRYAHAARQRTMTNEERAVDVFRSLAEQGDAKAQYRLGAVYEQQGKLKEASHWYNKAADQGLPLALEKTGRQSHASVKDKEVFKSGSAQPQDNISVLFRKVAVKPGTYVDPGISVEEFNARTEASIEAHQKLLENQRLADEQRVRAEQEDFNRRQAEEWRQRSMQQ